MSGRTLAEALGQGALEPENAARIGAGVARMLARMHREGRIHGAVRPENVVLDEPPTWSASVVAASAPWLAPEGAIDARSDVFALGLVLYRMLAGSVPAAFDPIPPIPVAVPATLEHITRRALQPHSADRYADAGPIVQALDAWLATRTPATPPPVAGRSLLAILLTVASVTVGSVLVAVGTVGIGFGDQAEDAVDAERALAWVNTVDPYGLVSAGVHERGVAAILANRPFRSLEVLGGVPGITPEDVDAIAAAAR